MGGVLLRQARDRGAARALAYGPATDLRWLTYAQLADAANALAHQLDGIPRGERVVVWGANCVESVVVEYAVAARGLVLAPFNTAWSDREAALAADLVEPAVLFSGEDGRGGDYAARAAQLPGSASRRHLGEVSALIRDASAPSGDAFADVDAAEPFLIQFTSGTTGRAKGAVLSHRAVLNSAYLRLRPVAGPHDVTLNSVPFHHIGGSVFIILGSLTTGGSFVVAPRFSADESVQLLAAAGVTQLGGVPTMIERILDHPNAASRMAHLNMVSLGGTDISPALVSRIRDEVGATVMNTFGQSECPLISSTTGGESPEVVSSTVGRVALASQVRIVDVGTHAVLSAGEVGEIEVRSPFVMNGYFRMPEQTAAALRPDGFLRTGDLGCFDAEGYLSVRGRLREVIIRGGENIYPAEVEAALDQHPAVLMSAVVGLPDPTFGEQVAACVVTKASMRPGAVEPTELEEFLASRLAYFKIPRIWRFTDQLPMTASGKIRRTEVKATMSSPAERCDA